MRKYCYLEPKFPKEAFIVSLFVMKDGPQGMVTISFLFTETKYACEVVEETLKAAEIKNFDVPELAVMTYLKFDSLVPLKREYWAKPTMHYDGWERNGLFTKMLAHPHLYSTLVVPTYIDGKDQELQAVLPMKVVSDKTIENFMMSSDQIVDERSKYAAIYTFDHRMKFNWKTGEISDVTPDKFLN